ncbi:hypothetical protein RND81_10G171100 [Saponaria officinalis]|uniref:Uncharacterized protein n=1 Tax=Saponaria officinalis TaxID=3572 RepID=A0AAW1I3R6_SAPOF
MAKFLIHSTKPSSISPKIITKSSIHHINPKKFNPYQKPKLSNPISFKIYSSSSPNTECPVPIEQQPIIEYQNLSNSLPFSWASAEFVEYASRLFATGLSFGFFVGLPISWVGSVGSDHDPVKLVLGFVSSGLFFVTLAVLRMYLGWAYVGNRLLSATVEYEETGWYDGQVWVKTAEVLARDRLLGSFQVKPVLSRLKNSLVALAISLCLCAGLFIDYEDNQKVLRKSSYGAEERVVAGVYSDSSARSFEPDAFCGEASVGAE